MLFTDTDPLKKDTDGNGINDGDEDLDGDGLSNLEEFKYGTYPFSEDTDKDGINDYDEIFVNKTNPLKADTDGDGALDGWEIENGFDPPTHNKTYKKIRKADR